MFSIIFCILEEFFLYSENLCISNFVEHFRSIHEHIDAFGHFLLQKDFDTFYKPFCEAFLCFFFWQYPVKDIFFSQYVRINHLRNQNYKNKQLHNTKNRVLKVKNNLLELAKYFNLVTASMKNMDESKEKKSWKK